ncbi:MAG: outer membrane protein assembly factor BamA [Epsilonproteobacteria bacterium]|nr:outer membrane protein assembly factor BamA [Campylobacterota bacterium]
MKKTITLSLIVSAFLNAQTITSVKYEGLIHLSDDMASDITQIRVGEEVDPNKIDKAIKSLYKQGYFSDIWVSYEDNNALVFHFKEKSNISSLELNGYKSKDEAESVFQQIGVKKGDLYDATKIEKASFALKKKIEDEGFYDTVVEVETIPKDESIGLVFNVNKGEKIYIKNIDFAGANNLSHSELQKALANKEEDIAGWLPGLNNGVAKIDQLEYDSARLKDTYMQNGYLDAEVSDSLMRVDSGSYKADISYKIKEGEQYRVGDVSIASLPDGVDKEELNDSLKLLKGKVFNVNKMRTDIELIRDAVGDLGYAYAKVSPNFHKNNTTKTVDVQYMINTGRIVTINDVIISGNHTTKDRVIRRDIYLAPNDKFSIKDLKDSKNALQRSGYFEKVDIEPQRVSEDMVNLLVKVKETHTGSIQAGGGYGSYQGFMLNASLNDRNIMGSGIDGSLGFDLSKVSTNFNLSLSNPRVWDSEYSGGIDLYKSKYEYSSYKDDSFGGSLTIGKKFGRNLKGFLSYGYSDTQIDIDESTYSGYRLFNDNDLSYKKGMVSTRLTYDTTDDYYTPREGMIASGSLGYAGVGGDQEFLKGSANLGLYYGLEDTVDYDLILRYKLKANAMKDQGNISPAETLFLGGVSSVRGYEFKSIAPHTDNGNVRTFTGKGLKSLVNTVEASVPLVSSANMRLAFFYDYGMIGETNFNEIQKAGYGASIEWYSPMGPINLVFGRAVNADNLDRTSSFEFTMGTRF